MIKYSDVMDIVTENCAKYSLDENDEPVKERIEDAVERLEASVKRLKERLNRLEERCKESLR